MTNSETDEDIIKKAAFLSQDSYENREKDSFVKYENNSKRFIVIKSSHTSSGFDGTVYLDTERNKLIVAISM